MLLNESRVREVLERYQIDILVATTPENVTYCTDFWSLGHWLLPGVECYAVLTPDRSQAPYLILSQGELDLLIEQGADHLATFTYGTFYYEMAKVKKSDQTSDSSLFERLTVSDGPYRNAQEALVSLFHNRGWSNLSVALDERGTTPSTFSMLENKIDNLKVRPGYALFQEIRAVKTPGEIERIREATRITERAIEAVLAEVHVGMTEKEMAKVFNMTVIKEGGTPLLTVIGCGEHSALGNAIPSDRKVRKGDIIRFDVGCRYKQYCSDIARIVVFGTATAKQRSYYQAILEGENQALGLVEPGVTAGAIYQAALEGVRRAGISHYRRHHVGHGIGIEVYDPPLLAPDNSMPLEASMVLNIETPYYELGFGGLQVEDTLVVTEQGYELLTESSRDFRLIID